MKYCSICCFLFRNKIDDIVEHVTSLNLLAQYAKACEADGHFKRAAQAYETAHDYENAVRYVTCGNENIGMHSSASRHVCNKTIQ